tara:strand:- start:190 stop:1149 length:960 start_codon:yes stop_codon:yes gene_type:complete
MNKDDYKKDFLQPVLNTQKDYDTFIVENSSRKARDETIEESADRYVWLHAGGDKPKTYDDPFIKKIDTMARLPQVNKLVDQKLQGNKTLNYINKNKNMYQKENNKMLPTDDERKQKRIDNHTLNQWGMSKPKLAELPIIKQNIKNGVHYSGSREHLYDNPTVKKYADFKENKKIKEEELKFKKEFDKDYSNVTMEKEILVKENKNIREGKAPHAGFTSSDQIVAVEARKKAKESLAAIKAEHVKLKPSYFDLTALEDTGPKLSLKEHMAKVAPKVIDPGGITELRGVRKFRDTMEFANEKFPRQLGGGLAPLLGEDDAK